jgi:hypothetical protein
LLYIDDSAAVCGVAVLKEFPERNRHIMSHTDSLSAGCMFPRFRPLRALVICLTELLYERIQNVAMESLDGMNENRRWKRVSVTPKKQKRFGRSSQNLEASNV